MIDYRSDNTGRSRTKSSKRSLANTGTALGYGGDEWTAQLQQRYSDLFETPARVSVATGTAANMLVAGLARSILGPRLLQRDCTYQHIGDQCESGSSAAGSSGAVPAPASASTLRPWHKCWQPCSLGKSIAASRSR